MTVPTKTKESSPNSAEEIARNVATLKSRMRGRPGSAAGRGKASKKVGGGGVVPDPEWVAFNLHCIISSDSCLTTIIPIDILVRIAIRRKNASLKRSLASGTIL